MLQVMVMFVHFVFLLRIVLKRILIVNLTDLGKDNPTNLKKSHTTIHLFVLKIVL